MELTVRDRGIGGIPEAFRITPTDLTEDVALGSRKTVDTLEIFENRRCVGVFTVGVNECQDVAVETKEQSNLRSSTQVGDNRCHLRRFALVDNEWVVDGYFAL